MSDTQQPIWKFVAQLGDVHPFDHGGLFVYEDETGVYPPEAEKLIVLGEDEEHTTWKVRRFVLANLKLASEGDNVYLISAKYDATWPHPLANYDEWFHKDLKDLTGVNSSLGLTVDEMRQYFVSASSSERARAWEELGEYYGWDNLDSYPLIFSDRADIVARYVAK